MSNEETNSLYLCAVRDYHALHKWDAGGTPSQAMEIQEMGVDGQGSRETGGSTSDRIFFMKYPMSFLQHWYGTFPPALQDTTTTGTSDVSLPSVGPNLHADMAGESSSGGTRSKFPHLPPSKAVVFNYWTLVDGARNLSKSRETICCDLLSTRVRISLNARTREVSKL